MVLSVGDEAGALESSTKSMDVNHLTRLREMRRVDQWQTMWSVRMYLWKEPGAPLLPPLSVLQWQNLVSAITFLSLPKSRDTLQYLKDTPSTHESSIIRGINLARNPHEYLRLDFSNLFEELSAMGVQKKTRKFAEVRLIDKRRKSCPNFNMLNMKDRSSELSVVAMPD